MSSLSEPPAALDHVITIDGGNKVGKGRLLTDLRTAIRRHLPALSVTVISTGNLYRAFAFAALDDTGNSDVIARTRFKNGALAMSLAKPHYHLNLRGGVVTGRSGSMPEKPIGFGHLQAPAVGKLTPHFAAMPEVREFCNRLFHREIMAASKGLVILDGRDCGTVVAPTAAAKFFLTANLEVKADRAGLSIEEVKRRDDEDEAQSEPAADAYIIDTSDDDIPARVQRVLDYAAPRIPALYPLITQVAS